MDTQLKNQFLDQFLVNLSQAKKNGGIKNPLYYSVIADTKKAKNIDQFRAILKSRYKPFEFERLEVLLDISIGLEIKIKDD